MQRPKRSMETLTVTLMMRQEGLQEQGEEEDIASEDEEQVNCGARAWAETGMSRKKRVSSLRRREKIVMTTDKEERPRCMGESKSSQLSEGWARVVTRDG